MPVTIKSAREIELMAEAGRILEIVHNELRDALPAGMSTDTELEHICMRHLKFRISG